ncbi:MAG: HAD family phosphatase [Deltaproteobacteria bacterium]|nr:HAD family phosphatase [Deltaproteobacteria bacterium]
MSLRAVIFDLGGVVLGSPLHAIARYEAERGLSSGAVNRRVAQSGPGGAWARLERGELSMEAFFTFFEAECRESGFSLDARELFTRMADEARPRPRMLEAVRRIRANGLRAGALTNNWVSEGDGTRLLAPHFDAFVESSAVGLRKPDPRIYELTCSRLEVRPVEAAFLDDIGSNLKAARALGMTTIRVTEPEAALRELEEVLGFALG